jgi:hypothetical protein
LDLARVGRRLSALSHRTLPAVGDRVPGNLEQPGHERDTSPFEATEIGKRLVKDFGRQILGLTAAAGSTDHERVDAVEVLLVQVGEALRVGLGGLDQAALVVTA